MDITLVGISHKTAPVAVRERFAFDADELADVLPRFGGGAVVLSTCNRTETYLAAHHTISGRSVVALLGELKGWADASQDGFFHLTGIDAARHLFRVSAGIESMVLGEHEILGQVRSAYSAATAAHTHNAVLSRLFHTAIRVGRKARSQTGIGRHTLSISSTAVELARCTLGDIACKTVLVVSAGEAGKLAARSLAEGGASRLMVSNRTAASAKELAAELGGEPVPFRKLGEAMAQADIVVSSSGASGFLIGPREVARATARRDGRALVLMDIAVPRDVDPAVRALPNVHVFDIDDLQEVVERNRRSRKQEVAKVERIIGEEVERFGGWMRERGVVPTVAALRGRADMLREAEVARTLKRLGDLTPKQRAGLDAMAAALMKKLLHDPIDRLKGEDGERYVGPVRELFVLDEESPADEADPDTQIATHANCSNG